MLHRLINPWPWSLNHGYSQAALIPAGAQQLIVSGQTSVNAEGAPQHPRDMRAQIALSLDNLQTVLEVADMSMENVTRLGIFATDMDAVLANFDLIGMRFGPTDNTPPMTLLGVEHLALSPLMFEIEATAHACP
ncbi:MAG: RidA family protein [Marinovum sp.]|nr:RidA family protein [Marinovum sp.]